MTDELPFIGRDGARSRGPSPTSLPSPSWRAPETILATGMPATVEPSGCGAQLHVGVLETVAAGDPEAARTAMQGHYRFAREPAYAALHAIPFRDFPRAQERLRPSRGEVATQPSA
jgi:hypothetical protein